MKLKVAMWVAAAAVGTLVVLTIIAALGSRTEPLRKLVVATLQDRLDSDVDLKASVDLFPAVTVRGDGLTLRLRNLSNPSIPPFIQIERFTVHCGLFDLMRRPRRFKHVTLEGLVINIPPGGLKKHGNPIARLGKGGDKDGGGQQSGESPIIIDELLADGALLRIIPRREGKQPKEFAIHALTMRTLGVGQQMPFTATLTNPLPKGQIETKGTFGPWKKGDPGGTPLAGTYSFQNADLGTIKGIGEILNSTGEFAGERRIAVKGETHVPDFHVDISGQPVALDTTYEAVVDGTDGDTYLNVVNARFLQTALTAKGAVTGTKGVKGKRVKLTVHIQDGRDGEYAPARDERRQAAAGGKGRSAHRL